MSCYYTIVKSEFIYVYEGSGLHMWERNSVPCPVRIGKPQRMHSPECEEKRCRKGKMRKAKKSNSFVSNCGKVCREIGERICCGEKSERCKEKCN